MNPVQQYYWEHKTRRNLWLKPRQKGLSKVIDADQLIDCLRKPTNAVVISHDREATTRLFAAVKYYVDNMPVRPAVSIDSKSEMKFPKRGSSYFIGTAGQRAFGRGDTIDRAHLSEAAFYYDLEKILSGIAEAAEYGIIDIETTANGRGQHFYDLWQKAKKGLSPYTAFFIPWYFDQEYNANSLTEEERGGLSVAVQEMFNTPEDEIILTEEEKDLIKRAKLQYNIDVNLGQIKWRRYKIWDKGQLFWQEYPEDDESCFLQSGRSVFNHIKFDPTLKLPLDDITKIPTEQLDILKKRIMYGGIDGAEGVLEGDRHVFAVMDVNPENQKAYVAYQYASNEPIDIFWLKILPVLREFKINLGIENNGVGVAHVQQAKKIKGLRYMPWETTGTSRPVMITDLEEDYRKENLIETYEDAQTEALNMIYNENNRPEHPKGKHDDCVFARAIALQMLKMPKPRVS